MADKGGELRLVYNQNPGKAVWITDDQLVFLGSDGLNIASAPEYEPVIVQPGFRSTEMLLVGRNSFR